MNNETIKNNYLKVARAHIKLIKANTSKFSNYFKLLDEDNNKNIRLKIYEKNKILNFKYYNLLSSIGKFINKYNINVDEIDKSTINLINYYQKIYSSNKPNDIIKKLNITLDKARASNNQKLMNNTIKLMNKLLI